MRDFDHFPAKTAHPYAWLWEPLEGDASFVLRSMFGGKAVYVEGQCQFVCFAKHDPWCGMLVCTDRQSQASLIKEFPSLSPHPVVTKWLYLPERADDFESAAQRLVALVGRRDGRIGVESSPKKKKTVGRKTTHQPKGKR